MSWAVAPVAPAMNPAPSYCQWRSADQIPATPHLYRLNYGSAIGVLLYVSAIISVLTKESG
jgi:hypothetical protein